MWEGCELII